MCLVIRLGVPELPVIVRAISDHEILKGRIGSDDIYLDRMRINAVGIRQSLLCTCSQMD